MNTIVCPLCHGRGTDVEIKCLNCEGSGYDPNEDNVFAQCHDCHGDGTIEVDICPDCQGTGKIDKDEYYDEDHDLDDDIEDEDEDEDEDNNRI